MFITNLICLELYQTDSCWFDTQYLFFLNLFFMSSLNLSEFYFRGSQVCMFLYNEKRSIVYLGCMYFL